jgi:hypothetical protein
MSQTNEQTKHDPDCDCGICAYCNGQEDIYGNPSRLATPAASTARPNEGERRFGAIVVRLLQNHFDDARRLALLTRVQHDADGPFVDVRSNADKAKIEKLEAAVAEIANHPHCSYDHPSNQGGSIGYGTGIVDGHRCAATIARAAIESTKEKSDVRTTSNTRKIRT